MNGTLTALASMPLDFFLNQPQIASYTPCKISIFSVFAVVILEITSSPQGQGQACIILEGKDTLGEITPVLALTYTAVPIRTVARLL